MSSGRARANPHALQEVVSALDRYALGQRDDLVLGTPVDADQSDRQRAGAGESPPRRALVHLNLFGEGDSTASS